MIEKVHVLYDSSKDKKTKKHPILDYLWAHGIKVNYIKGRPTVDYCFSIANTYYPNRRVILSNADIYFNETLNELKDYDFTNKFLALTRWDDDGNGNLKAFIINNIPWISSQDTWIIKTPLQKFWPDDIQLGMFNCEPWIMYHALREGLKVINPCISVQCCHLHVSNVRNYGRSHHYAYPAGFISEPWSKL